MLTPHIMSCTAFARVVAVAPSPPPAAVRRRASIVRAASADGGGDDDGRAPSTSKDVVLEAQLEAQRAKAAVTRRKIAAAVNKQHADEEARVMAEKESEEAARRERSAREALEVGGRDPFHRKAGPIFIAGVACSAAAFAAFEATVNTGDFISAFQGASGPAKSGVLSLTIGLGLVGTSSLAFSSMILFALAFQEAKGVILNDPVIYYRCDGKDKSCCVNGPHNLGYHSRFVYLNNGRGFETREADSMRRHLRISKDCRALKPLIVYPKEEKWGFW